MARITSERASDGGTATALSSWLAEYVRRVARAEGPGAARQRAAHLGLFVAYLQRRGLVELPLPWWEYLDAVGWIRRQARGSWIAATRVLDTLRDFHAGLERAGHLPAAWELERATAIVRGGRQLRWRASLERTGAETWRLWRTADGQLAPVSFGDRWLGLLWAQNGRSWSAVAARLRGSCRGAEARHAARAPCSLRDGTLSGPGRLAAGPVRTAELEALSCWLAGPTTTAARAASTAPGLDRSATAELLERLASAPPTAMPRREMAELCRRGAAASRAHAAPRRLAPVRARSGRWRAR